MTPVPIIVLLFAALFIVRAIILVVFCQVSSVRMIFTIIPIVVVMVARIVDSDLNTAFLWRCGAHYESTRREGSRQEQRAYVSMCTVHIVNSPDRNSQIADFEITVARTMCFALLQ